MTAVDAIAGWIAVQSILAMPDRPHCDSVTGLAAPCTHHLLDKPVPSRSSRQIIILWGSACRCLQLQLRALQPRRTLQRPPCSRRLLAQPSRFPAQPTMVSESRGCRRASARHPAGSDASSLRSCTDSSMLLEQEHGAAVHAMQQGLMAQPSRFPARPTMASESRAAAVEAQGARQGLALSAKGQNVRGSKF